MRAPEPIWVLTMDDRDGESPFPIAAYVEKGRKAWTLSGRKEAMGSHARLTYASDWSPREPSPINSRPMLSSAMNVKRPDELRIHPNSEASYAERFGPLSNDEELWGFFDV
jgi:hypothetical protein